MARARVVELEQQSAMRCDGNKDGQPIVDTRMMLFLKLHAPLGGRVGADRFSLSEH
jgi:hypothetical protein